jgi:DNA-binding CsgD family transcriptional regulator
MTPATTPSGQRDRRAKPVASDALSAELVVELYVTQRLSSVVIAERLGTSPRAVCEQLHRVGVTPRGARSSRMALLPRELLVELYVERGLSSDAIARQVGCSSQAVREQLRRSAIPLRPPGTSSPATAALTPEVLRDLYGRQGLAMAEIAARFGCSVSGVRKLLLRHGIPVRSKLGKRVRPDDPLSADVLRRLYVDERLPIAEVARRLDTSRDKVALRLRRYGIPVRPGGREPADPKLGETVAELYVGRGLSVDEVGQQVGISAQRVRNLLRAAGVALRPPPPRPLPPGLEPLTRELLVELYVEQRLTMAEVAERVGGSASRVGAALDQHGIPRRPRGSRSLPGLQPLSREVLIELYANERLGSVSIARRLGGHPSRILHALDRFGIPVRARPRPGDIDVERLAELYVERRMSLEEVADALGVSVNQVRVTVRREKLRRPPAPRPEPPAPPAAVLEELYVTQGLTLSQIGRRYRTTHYRVHDWLVAAGIPVAPRTTRAHRRSLPRELLEEMYVAEGMTAREIGAELECPPAHVLRALHDFAIPVRFGGTPRRRHPDDELPAMQLLDELYGDPDVLAVLARHDVPLRPEAGTIAERFPEPVAVGPALLEDLYVTTGLSARHVELLTGQPAEQLLDAMHAANIPVRPLASFSPWRRRKVEVRRGR